jgi:hypothetical protein
LRKGLDAGADLAQFGGLFEHLNLEAGASKRQRRREPADPGIKELIAFSQDNVFNTRIEVDGSRRLAKRS